MTDGAHKPTVRRRGSARGDRFAPDLMRPSQLLLRSPTLFALSVAFTLALALLAAFTPEVLLRVDRPITEFLRNDDWMPFFRVVTEVGRPWAVAALSVVVGVLLWRRCKAFALALPVTALSALVIDVAIKLAVSRRRPPFGIGATEDPTSFPSGHVMLAVIVLGLLVPVAYLLTERRWVYWSVVVLFFVYVPVVMLSRIMMGAHWFTDVVGSFFIGAAFLLAAEYLVGTTFADEHCSCRLHTNPHRSHE